MKILLGGLLVFGLTGFQSSDADGDNLKNNWESLRSTDGEKAYRAIVKLAAMPAVSVPFMEQRLQPVKGISRDNIQQLAADLGSDQFAVRDRAQRALEKLQDSA